MRHKMPEPGTTAAEYISAAETEANAQTSAEETSSEAVSESAEESTAQSAQKPTADKPASKPAATANRIIPVQLQKASLKSAQEA